MAFLCWAELLATQSLFVMAPALLPVYGDGVVAVGAVAGLAVGAVMILLAWTVKRFMTVRIAMWLYLPMAVGYLFVSFLPPFRLAVIVLLAVGFMAVQVAFVRAEAPKLARSKAEQGFILTAVSSWLVLFQAAGSPAVLAAAIFLSPEWALRLTALVLVLAFASGMRFATAVESCHGSQRKPEGRRRLSSRRLWWAASYNFFNLGQVGCWLMPMTLLLTERGYGSPWSLSAVTSAAALVGIAMLLGRARLEPLSAHLRMRWAASIGLTSTALMVLTYLVSGLAFLAVLITGFVLSQTAVTAGEGAAGDIGTGRRRAGEAMVGWSGAEQLVLNSASAFGFSIVGWIATRAVVDGWSVGGVPAVVLVLASTAGAAMLLTTWKRSDQPV